MDINQLHTPEGVRDIYDDEYEFRSQLNIRILSVFRKYGFKGIQTPGIEYSEVFSRETGTIPSTELYRFSDREGRTLVLRPDFTPAVSRCYSSYYSCSNEPVKLFYSGKTYINGEDLRGMLKENTQSGVELIGDSSIEADAEVVSMLCEVLLETGIKDFQISVGSAHFITELLSDVNLSAQEENLLKDMISGKNLFAIDKFLNERDIEGTRAEIIRELPGISGNSSILYELKKRIGTSPAVKTVDRLLKFSKLMEKQGFEKYITYELGLISRFHYYSGIVFKAYTYGTGDAVAKGGRYDGLIAKFGKTDAPAIGFVIEEDKLGNILLRRDQEENTSNIKDSSYITFALTKGRMAVKTLELLKEAGIDLTETMDENSRKLVFTNEELKIRFFLAKAQDVPTYVEQGTADFGVAGKDVILEEKRKIYEVLDLGIGKCRMCVCGPAEMKDLVKGNEQIKVATKYPVIAREYFNNRKHRTVEIIKLNGSVELGPVTGLSEVIVDIVETGTTLKENGLEVLEEICDLSARLVVNRVSMRIKNERVKEIIEALRKNCKS